jgi:hypothetical protein
MSAQSKQTATLANVAASATSVVLFAAKGGAAARTVYNDSSDTLYVKFGATASTTSFTVQMASETYLEFPQPLYGGLVHGIWSGTNGAARVTEW